MNKRKNYTYCTKIDLSMFYHCLMLDDASKELCTINTPFGLYCFNRLPQGSAGAAFQRTYLRRVVVPVASQLGLKDQYAYLEPSLEQFLTGAEQEDQAIANGFVAAQHRSLVAGQMGVLLLVR